MFLVFIR